MIGRLLSRGQSGAHRVARSPDGPSADFRLSCDPDRLWDQDCGGATLGDRKVRRDRRSGSVGEPMSVGNAADRLRHERGNTQARKAAQLELHRARRARSRKNYAFWAAVAAELDRRLRSEIVQDEQD
jgi:hypothetical protein